MIDAPAERSREAESFELTPQQRTFYEVFGFLHLRGLFADEIGAISDAFDEAFAAATDLFPLPDNPFHRRREDRQTRLILPGILDRHPVLTPLRTDPRVLGVATALLGPDLVYAESDGNLFDCDLTWHVDAYGSPIDQNHVKVFFYLDRLTRDTGALRVMPGTQFLTGDYAAAMRRDLAEPEQVGDIFGVPDHELPSWTLEVEPGDVIVGNFRTFHASFGGKTGRRLFTVNFATPG